LPNRGREVRQRIPFEAYARVQMQTLTRRWRELGVDIAIDTLTYRGDHHDVPDYLHARGWTVTRSTIADLFAAAGLALLHGDDLVSARASIGYVVATRS
jgi:hypothetical protein